MKTHNPEILAGKLAAVLVVLLATLMACEPQAEVPVPVAEIKTDARVDSLVLFNGTSFDGWEGVNEFFRVEDQAIVAGSIEKPVPQNEFLCTVERFSSFRLALETKTVGEMTNAGIQFHTERIPNDNEVIGYQADIGVGYWGSLYDESRRNKLLATADPDLIEEILNVDGWNHYLLETRGSDVRIEINGRQTISYTEQDSTIPLEGHICLQIHSGPPGEQWYRSIVLAKLD